MFERFDIDYKDSENNIHVFQDGYILYRSSACVILQVLIAGSNPGIHMSSERLAGK